MKTPTTILLRPNKEFDSFGYDAVEKYVHFQGGQEKDYYYFEHFKMELHNSEVTNVSHVLVFDVFVEISFRSYPMY